MKNMEKIFVTKTFLPPIDEYISYLRDIWESGMVTNDGPVFQKFERALAEYTGVNNLVCLGNGTWALQIAIRALDLKGEVITTPFTHVASSGSLVWEGCTPVYCDIDEKTLNIDPAKIEAQITKDTSAILAVHVYSNPCDIESIERIAKKHNLRTIYDGAHAFGAVYKGKSVFGFGDISMASFNATKAFHTIEGGALFTNNEDMVTEIRKLAYFGMDEAKNIVQQYGTNAKLIEFCAAMGLVNLKYFEEAVARKKELYFRYKERLGANKKISYQSISDTINYSYMPIILESSEYKNVIISTLRDHEVYPREYFSPSLETVFKNQITCPIASDISNRILCLPMSDYLTSEQVDRICDIINGKSNCGK